MDLFEKEGRADDNKIEVYFNNTYESFIGQCGLRMKSDFILFNKNSQGKIFLEEKNPKKEWKKFLTEIENGVRIIQEEKRF